MTDSIIPSSSCHPREHKHSAIRYLHNRLLTYPISEHRQHEEQVIAHILHQTNYPPMPPTTWENKLQQKSQQKPTDTAQQTQHK
jgi:hypothetical protein